MERLELHATSLAQEQHVAATARGGRALFGRVQENRRALREAHRTIAVAVGEGSEITPAAEWLVDNFHVVDEQLREIREDLPPAYYRELPKLRDGWLSGYPRVYGLAWAFVAHTDSHLDLEILRRFVQAYQRVQPLTIGELWAVAITLRIVLVENLRRLADAIVQLREVRAIADEVADDLIGPDGHDGERLTNTLRRVDQGPVGSAFVVELVQRLRHHDPAVTPALVWINQRLAREHTTAEDIVRLEHQRQAAMTVTVRNIITSMRLLSAVDWAEFVESVSSVDGLLRRASSFGAMDFSSRDSYRHAIEELARGSGHSEAEIARIAIELCTSPHQPTELADPTDIERERDPGHYLVGDGRPLLEQAIGFEPDARQRVTRTVVNAGLRGYVGAIALLTALIATVPLVLELRAGEPFWPMLGFIVVTALLASDLAIAVTNRILAEVIPPRTMPRLELLHGPTARLGTLVVMPILLTSMSSIEEDIERLEVHYLANPDGDVRFALLSDWCDAETEEVAEDAALLAQVRSGIARLNLRHGTAPDGGGRFLVLHRRRRWNDRERVWMGWERKRGKLEELNRLLRGVGDTSFVLAEGDAAPLSLPGIRYVITLDADTRLPLGAVSRLVGTMAHPINRPRLDRVSQRVTAGYGILQPRVTPPLLMHRGSLLQWLASAPPGVDVYAAAVSDVYQDLFGEGSYTGKAIYDVDAFAAALAGRVPENAVLSHDLFEGTFARAGSVSDIELFEPVPGHYAVVASRQHRWARGDWQLLPWILRSTVPAVGRWKMIDNLRRTLFAPAAIAVLAMAWSSMRTPPLLWAIFVLAMVALPAFLPVVAELVPRRPGVSKRSFAAAARRDAVRAACQTLMVVSLFAHQAALMCDAIGRAIVRLLVTRRHLLEWVPAAQAAAGAQTGLADFFVRMWGGLLVVLLLAASIMWRNPGAWPAALPFLLVWAASPAIARWLSLPRDAPRIDPLSDQDAVALRLIARRTWQFFATFVGAEDNALPPDNFQETPDPVVAHRTSPTNIGMYLLSTVTARDLGWIGTLDAVDRLEATCTSLGRLEHHRGHLYNWYDTRDSRPLEPKYVSTVDSGNLAACLITLGRACREMLARPFQDATTFSGPADAAALLRSAVAQAIDQGVDAGRASALLHRLDSIDAITGTEPEASDGWTAGLRILQAEAAGIAVLATELEATAQPGLRLELHEWASALQQTIASHGRDRNTFPEHAGEGSHELLRRRLQSLVAFTEAAVREMDFKFLFDPLRKLFSIGFRIDLGMLDTGRYDLLASEARLTSLVAIAKGDAPVSHWFHLGRPLTPVGPDSVLMSWSGSMFEYLMPEVLMRSPTDSLLEQSCRLVVRRQIGYAGELGVPWGISESGYSTRDVEHTYQYSHFGIPGLGLRRGLRDDLVIAPYATGLAALYDPAAALRNFRRIAEAGGCGVYGFYEALDYTRGRLPANADVVIVRSYMAHHEAMLLLAVGDVLTGGGMRTRFQAEPMLQACELLLQERTPHDVAVARPDVEDVSAVLTVREPATPIAREFDSPHTATPQTHLLSNGHFTTMITAAGTGYSRRDGLAITRWREDVTRETGGIACFVRDVRSGERWGTGDFAGGTAPDQYSAVFYEDHAEFARRDGTISTALDVLVSPEDDVELRRVSLTNLGTRARELEITSYVEIALAPQGADSAHPAFSNLFVQTEALPAIDAVLATRRPRASTDESLWLAHVVAVDGDAAIGDVEWETDRERFIGRGHDVGSATAIVNPSALSNTTGAVLDPVIALRRRVRVPPRHRVRLVFSTLVASSREAAVALAEKYHESATYERAATMAWSQAQVQLHHLGIDADDANLYQALASNVIFSTRNLRAPAALLARQTGTIGALWSHGISGDLPIVMVRIDESEDVAIVRAVLHAHEYWRMKGLAVDLVILNDRAPSYVQDLQALLDTLARASRAATRLPGSESGGGVFVLRSDQMSSADCDVLESVARVVLSSHGGTLSEQLHRTVRADVLAPPAPADAAPPRAPARELTPGLEFFNGLGGFGADGREYVITLSGHDQTPAPWINVIANPDFGFQVSEAGSGYTWSQNSQINKLTPWSNDPVCDPAGEVLYVRDDDTGEVWGPTAHPIREAEPYVIRHGQGYSRFEHTSHGIGLELLQFVPEDDPVKVSRLRLVNRSGRSRRLSVTAYVEWVIGAERAASAPFVVTEIDRNTGTVLARNTLNRDFGGRVAFADLAGRQTQWTCDRTEFLGRHGRVDRPRALHRPGRLAGRVGAGYDPCAALQAEFVLPPGGSTDVAFLLGEAASHEAAATLVAKYRSANLDETLAAVARRWDDILGTVQVTTPDRALDLMLNRWLLYQTLACRLWARAAFYQASGAFGFRDQLQDVMALVVPRPDLARAHILRAAARQFAEGDVQHWWHPPTGRGVRTRISDDLLWLPFTVGHYLEATGDTLLLDAPVPFLDGPALPAGQLESYFEPRAGDTSESLYEHCARAIDHSLGTGVHGLPLIGAGDWNDGMNRVGAAGKGESVWLGWFLSNILGRWSGLAESRGDGDRVERWRRHAGALHDALDREGWDGAWYRRAWFDDGTPLGSAMNDECQIDSITQSWSVIAGTGDAERRRTAMASLDQRLVRPDDALVLLLTPPFDHGSLDPGYIKGYVPGVRENGGQYTHAAAWAVIAFAEMGQGDRAATLFGFLNPINHSRTRSECDRYRVEPYVAAADVYGEPPHVGRGGWTWYTGSAGWLYRAGIEWILGIRLHSDQVVIDPCIPASWPGFEVTYRRGPTRYDIRVENPDGVSRGVIQLEVDGEPRDPAAPVPLIHDTATHLIRATLGHPRRGH